MFMRKDIEPELVHKEGDNDRGGNQRQRAKPLYPSLICFMLLLGGTLFCIGEAEAVTITVNPGESIQEAINILPDEGGIIELAAGMHEVNDTMYPPGTMDIGWGPIRYSILVNKSNVTITGTYSPIVRHHNKSLVCFFIPDLGVSEPPLENITFRNFSTISTYTNGNNYLISATHVKNFTIENMCDTSHALVFVGIAGSQTSTPYSENVYFRNNTLEHCGLMAYWTENLYILNNTIKDSRAGTAIYTGRNLKHVHIIGNYVRGGYNKCTTFDGGQYWVARGNDLGGSQSGCWIQQSVRNAIFENNTITGTTRAAIYIYPQGPMTNVTVRNNRIYDNKRDGIWTLEYHHAQGISPVNITNNIIYYNNRDGIRMETERVALNITNNIITDNGGYGINNIASNISWSHSFNDFWNNTQGKYNGTTEGGGEIEVDPNFADAENGDFHLKSTGGHWNGSTWVHDDVTSPCIDAGDPAADYSNEPEPNGGRINMGAYGNTVEASKSPPPAILSFYPLSSSVSDVEAKTRTFNITVDEIVSVTWVINGTIVQPINESVTEASYTNTSAKVGTWNVSAIATSITTGLSAMQTWIWIVRPAEFDTGKGTYPSIFGTHNGTITPSHDVYVSKMYTYPCAGTGGHSEYVRFYIYNDSWSMEANWRGYQSGDYHFITFDKQFTLEAGVTYNYTIRTGSYPQIHHTDRLETDDGVITCSSFKDANGRVYYDWIPAIRLE